jgi:hypothetical protein
MTILFAYDGSESADAASAAAGKLLDHFRSNVDGGHARLVVALAAGRGEFVQACDQLDAAGGRVLFDAGDPFGDGDRGDVVAREQPGQSDLPDL